MNALIHALRRLKRTPGFTTATVLTLALGIGANTAIFCVVEGVLLKPLPFPEGDRLVGVWQTAPGVNIKDLNASAADYFTYREEGRVFDGVGLWNGCAASVTGLAEPERVDCLQVTREILPLVGVHPVIGRIFSEQDDTAGSLDTVVLSYGYWQRRFGGDRGVIGRRIVADGKAREIIGVAPQDFWFMDLKPDLFMPLALDRAKVRLGGFNYQAIARLKPGVTLVQADADVARTIPIAMRKFPMFAGLSVKMFEEARFAPSIRPLKQDVTGDIGKTLWVLMAAIGLVLLIACANVANLLLVRAEGRHQELAIRAALGAGWRRIARELLTESVSLALMGGALGVAFAYGAVRWLLSLGPGRLPRVDQISIDGTVLLFTLAVSLLAGVLFGLIPVFKYATPRTAAGLRGNGRTASHSRERHRARSVLVVVQVAVALVLLIGSGLMIRTFQALRRVQPGFTEPQSIQTVRITIPEAQVREDERAARMFNDIVDRIAAVPGVKHVGYINSLPLSGSRSRDLLFAKDRTYAEQQLPPLRQFHSASPGYFAAMGISMVAGRDFTWTDVYQKRPYVIISENFAREYWGSASAAVAKQVRDTPNSPWREIIGVTGDVRDDGVDSKAPTSIYLPVLQDALLGRNPVTRSAGLVIRSERAGSESFLNEVRQAVWAVNPNLPLAQIRTLGEMYDRSMARTSFTLVLLAIAGGLALLLGVVGIYAVISYAVSQRTREIGIRMALGAQQRELKVMFVRHGLVLGAVGVAVGMTAAAALSRAMSALLFEISPLDPLTYAGVGGVLVLAAALASYVPARRVTSVDPAEALRAE